MGKAVIKENKGEGKYKIKLDYTSSDLEGRIQDAKDRISELEKGEIPKLESDLSSLESDYSYLQGEAEASISDITEEDMADFDEVLSDYSRDPTSMESLSVSEAVATTQGYINEANVVYTQIVEATRKQLSAQLELESTKKQLEYLESIETTAEELEVWCEDLTEDLNVGDEVGTVEHPDGTVQIQPGYEGNAAYSAERDGIQQPSKVSRPEQAYFNTAIKPGWKVWRPITRTGTVTDVDFENNAVSVDLDEYKFKLGKEEIDGNRGFTSIKDCPVEYMTCNAVAFKEGDKVVVKFENQSWDSPKVVGFVEKPKPCACCWIIAREIVHEEDNPIWDLDPYRYKGPTALDTTWRVLEWEYPQFHDIAGDVDKDSGELLDLPTRFVSNFSYDGFMAIIVCTEGLDTYDDGHANLKWSQDERYCPKEPQ